MPFSVELLASQKPACWYVRTKTEKTGNHKLSTVADSVNGAVLDHDTLVAGEKGLEGRDDLTEVGLVAVVVLHPLGIENVVEGDHILGLVHSTGPHTAQLLHVGANTEEKTQVHAEGTDIGTSLAADPEHTELPLIVELIELRLVDGTDTELTLDGGDERGALEERAGERLEGTGELGLAARQLVVKTDHAHVLLSGALLGLDETGGAVNADDQTSRDLGIQSSRVSSLLNPIPLSARLYLRVGGGRVVPQDALNPGDNFVRGRVRRLVEVNDAGANIRLQVAAERCAAVGNRGEVRGANEYCLDVSQRTCTEAIEAAAYNRCSSSAAAASRWCRWPAPRPAA